MESDKEEVYQDQVEATSPKESDKQENELTKDEQVRQPTLEEESEKSPLVSSVAPVCDDENINPASAAAISSQQIFLNNYAFNQDTSCFSISTTSDFRTFLFAQNGVSEVSRRQVNLTRSDNKLLTTDPAPVNVCSMLFQTNYLALVMKENPYKVLLWDDSLKQPPHEIWSRFEVLNVVLRRDVFCVVSEFKIYVYQFGGSFQVLLHLETCSNPRGLCQLSPSSAPKWILACPGSSQRGSLRIQIGLDDSISSTIAAHNNAVAAIGINSYGTMVASASEHGTVVKIFNTSDGKLMYELRRGTIGTQISTINFRTDNKYIVVGSSNPTVHIFRLDVPGSAVTIGQSMVVAKAQKIFGKLSEWTSSPILDSVLAIAPPVTDDPTTPALESVPSSGPLNVSSEKLLVPNYFKSFRSFATFRIPEKSAMDLRVVKSSQICGPLVTFSKAHPNRVLVVHFNGLVYEAEFDESSSELQQECSLIGASAYFQARPDFAIQSNAETVDDSNWLVI
jgi:hypothetical protein